MAHDNILKVYLNAGRPVLACSPCMAGYSGLFIRCHRGSPKEGFEDYLPWNWVLYGGLAISKHTGRDPFNQTFRKFRSKTQWIGSVQPEKFRKNGSTFWGGPLFPVGPVGILVEWIAPTKSKENYGAKINDSLEYATLLPSLWGGALRDDTKNGCVAD